MVNEFITEPGFYWVKDVNDDWTIVEASIEGYLLLYFLGSDASEKAIDVGFQEIRPIKDPDDSDLDQKVENEHQSP